MQIDNLGYARLEGVNPKLKVGESYQIYLNGTIYDCVAWWHDDWEAVMLGNGAFADAEGMGEDVPFAFEFYPEDDDAYLTAEEGEYEINVWGLVRQPVKTIPRKFLPDDVVYTDTLSEAIRLEQKWTLVGPIALAGDSGYRSIEVPRFNELLVVGAVVNSGTDKYTDVSINDFRGSIGIITSKTWDGFFAMHLEQIGNVLITTVRQRTDDSGEVTYIPRSSVDVIPDPTNLIKDTNTIVLEMADGQSAYMPVYLYYR